MSKQSLRHHRWRKIKRTMNTNMYRSYFEGRWQSIDVSDANVKKWRGRIATTPTPCSCWMCGNPRKYYGNGKYAKTLQERRAMNDDHWQQVA